MKVLQIILQTGLVVAFCVFAYQCLTLVNDISSYADITKIPALTWVGLITGMLAMFTVIYGVHLVETKLITKECE